MSIRISAHTERPVYISITLRYKKHTIKGLYIYDPQDNSLPYIQPLQSDILNKTHLIICCLRVWHSAPSTVWESRESREQLITEAREVCHVGCPLRGFFKTYPNLQSNLVSDLLGLSWDLGVWYTWSDWNWDRNCGNSWGEYWGNFSRNAWCFTRSIVTSWHYWRVDII